MQEELKTLVSNDKISVYQMESCNPNCKRYIASTPQTRTICNDTTTAGIAYTDQLREACAEVFRVCDFGLKEQESVVVNILRGSLNFGLRNALSDAYGWKYHNTSFISAQRARNSKDPEEWHITENSYQKVYFPRTTSLVIGDVVATGTSLRYALNEMIECAVNQKVKLKSIVFFTYGGIKAEEILCEIDKTCREHFEDYEQTHVIYFEGRFTVPNNNSHLSVRLTGTDLLRWDALMAPEFVESQYENPAYPIERCIIYDAGSRAFWIPEYAEDVIHYWRQNVELASRGISYEALLTERFPSLDASRFGNVDLRKLAVEQIKKIEQLIK